MVRVSASFATNLTWVSLNWGIFSAKSFSSTIMISLLNHILNSSFLELLSQILDLFIKLITKLTDFIWKQHQNPLNLCWTCTGMCAIFLINISYIPFYSLSMNKDAAPSTDIWSFSCFHFSFYWYLHWLNWSFSFLSGFLI